LCRAERLVEVLRTDAQLFGIEHGEVGPLDDIEPLEIVPDDHGAERLLGEDVRQDLVIVGWAVLRR
jgi:hypothetical protein